MMHCISCGYNAWIEVQKNGEQSYPILIPNPELDNPHNWTSSIATTSQPKTNFLNNTEKDLTENWICAFSCSEKAVEAYVKEGKITEGLIRLATDNVPEAHLCNIRKTDATKFRQIYTKDGYDYTKPSFYHLWKPKEGIPYYIPDPSIDKVFVVCYNNEPVNMKQSLEKVSALAKEMLANDNIQ